MWDESIPDLVDEAFEYKGPHGGPKETALIQHLHPELVHEDRLERARDRGVRDIEASDGIRTHGATTFYDSIDNGESGVVGDQTEATAETGAELFEAATAQLVQLAEWLDDRAFADLLPKDHV
jgi:creatinine amidohydrolase